MKESKYKEIIKQSSLSYAEVARNLDIKVTSLQNILSGKTKMTKEIEEKLDTIFQEVTSFTAEESVIEVTTDLTIKNIQFFGMENKSVNSRLVPKHTYIITLNEHYDRVNDRVRINEDLIENSMMTIKAYYTVGKELKIAVEVGAITEIKQNQAIAYNY